MVKKLKIIGIVSFILGIISCSWLIYNFIAFEQINLNLTEFKSLDISMELAKYVFWGFIVSFFFHLISFMSIIFQIQYFKKFTILKMITLFTGILSFFCLIGDWAALSDIGKQYQLGLSINMELTYLYLSLFPHVLFHILIFIILIFTHRDLRNQQQPEFALKDEIVFYIAQYIGTLCGFVGLCFIVLILFMNIEPHILKYIIPFYCPFIIFPYGFIVFYWLVMRRTQKLSDWYDEKQWSDIAKASLITILLSIPGMAVLFLINNFLIENPISIIWFPYYLFMTLLLFSGSTLFFSRKNI